MATAHVYVRVQVNDITDTQANAIVENTRLLQDAVEAAGGEWKGGCSVVLDAVAPEPTPEPEPEAPAA